jgi:hypothetical protein
MTPKPTPPTLRELEHECAVMPDTSLGPQTENKCNDKALDGWAGKSGWIIERLLQVSRASC